MISPEEQHVLDRLLEMGVRGEKVPEGSGRTADILASDAGSTYLIEVKTRTDDQTVGEELKSAGTAYRVSPLGWTNTTATIFQDGVGQLASHNLPGALRLIWLCVRSRRGSTDTLADQARGTLYGTSRIAGTGRGATAPTCYYFHESVFYRHRTLAGVVFDLGNRGALCVNNYSEAAAALKRSLLAEWFRDAVFDPEDEEREGNCLIADCRIDRRDSAAVLRFVSEKYGIQNAVHFNLDEHAGFRVVPRE